MVSNSAGKVIQESEPSAQQEPAQQETDSVQDEVQPGTPEIPMYRQMGMNITQAQFGTTSDGQAVTKFRVSNATGMSVEMIDYGATITSVMTPDRNGMTQNITLPCYSMQGYEACGMYFGCSVGRYCNRIKEGKFSIDGTEYTLATNNDPNHLHGGDKGFDKQMWTAEEISSDNSAGVRFTLVSPDGDEGYPGEVTVMVEYSITSENELVIDFKATTTAATHVNLTNHCYWNLAGAGNGDILGHQLQIEADKYLPVDETGIPTGELADVKETAFDFTSYWTVGQRISDTPGDPNGYDHCYALRSDSGELALAATVIEPVSGRYMEIHTTQPGLQFYSGNFLDGQEASGGFPFRSALCLETQHFPDAPNQSEFKSTRLNPGETYHQKTVHKFAVVR